MTLAGFSLWWWCLVGAAEAAERVALVEQMLHADEDAARREAARLLSVELEADPKTLEPVIEGLTYTPVSKSVPWSGGRLYLPRGSYQRLSDPRLMESLLAWQLFCERKSLTNEQKQIFTAFQQIELAVGIGMSRLSAGETGEMLRTWGRYAGRDSVETILKAQRQRWRPKYWSVLRDLPEE